MTEEVGRHHHYPETDDVTEWEIVRVDGEWWYIPMKVVVAIEDHARQEERERDPLPPWLIQLRRILGIA